MNCSAGVLTQPGSTGTETIALGTSFDPKAIFAWTTGLPAPAGVGSHAVIGWGVGTYRGSVVQQGFQQHFHTDAAATMNVNSEIGTDALLVLRPGGAATARDLEVDLVSMASDSVVINWTNLHATAAIQVNYLILGGSDISDALAFSFTSIADDPVTTQDVTVLAGFGQPDLLFMCHQGDAAGLQQASRAHLGWAKSDSEERYFSAANIEGNTNSCVRVAQGDLMIKVDEGTDVLDIRGSMQLSARAAWPTDGFEFNRPDANVFLDDVITLALKGTFTATVGSASSPTSVGDQDIVLLDGTTPKAIVIWGGNLPPTAGVDKSHADLLAWGIGASDMTVRCYAGVADDDGLGTSACNRSWTDQVAWQVRGPSNALLAECSAFVVGGTVRLTWTTVDSVAREFNYIIFSSDDPPLPAAPDGGVFRDVVFSGHRV